jgi:hypothetical protein
MLPSPHGSILSCGHFDAAPLQTKALLREHLGLIEIKEPESDAGDC